MKKGFSARRVPRKIGQDDDEPTPGSSENEGAPESTLKRPNPKPRKGTSLRTSFGPTAVEDADDEQSEPTGVITPKRSNLSRIAVQRNASKRSSALASNLPSRQTDEEDEGPSYSAASLKELKESTPSTPRDLATDNSEVDDVSSGTQALDLSSKFGSSLSRYPQSSAIPSASEIAEKKARRARLAKEHAADEYISLNVSDPEGDDDEEMDDNVMRDESGKLVLKPKDKYNQAESRLVRDDEDIMENFDEFTEADGKILLGRKAEAEAARKRKQDMAARIAEAEGDSDSDSNASERERNDAFEAAQTKHGNYGANHTSNDPYANARPKTPPKISPLPTLDGVIERLRKQVSEMQTSRMQKLQEMESLQREKIRLGEEEVRIQKALRETAEKFAQMRAEKGIAGAPPAAAAAEEEGTPSLLDAPTTGAGLGFAAGGDSGASTDVEQMGAGRAGLGFGGMTSRGLESLGPSDTGTPASGDGGGGDSDTMVM